MKSNGSNIVANLKKTSTIIDKSTGEIKEPTQGITAKQLTGKAGKPAILDILGSLNSEKD